MGNQRPNGEGPTAVGWTLIILGVLLAFFAGTADEISVLLVLGLLLAQLCIGLGVLLVSLGYIVRAIWFLPGRDHVSQLTLGPDQVTGSVPPARCAWCSEEVIAPNRPCSEVEPEKLAAWAPNARKHSCRLALVEHKFLEG